MVATVGSGCVATRKFTRNEVKTSADTLNTRIDKNEGEIGEVRDGVDRVNGRVTTVDGRVTELDGKTTRQFDTVNKDVQGVNQKAGQAQSTADRATSAVALLDQKFINRNNYNVSAEKTIQFKFNSDKLDDASKAVIEEAAQALSQSPDSLIVLEGRTDSTGDADYNVKLGERRVDAVRRYLAVDKSIAVYRIHDISFGSARPVAPNDSKEGREKNRAVVMTIFSQGRRGGYEIIVAGDIEVVPLYPCLSSR
jgi:outer membrane protein OmpA-like peptidoglycan-associated protein